LELIRFVQISKEPQRHLNFPPIRTKQHMAAVDGAAAASDTDAMKPWAFDNMSLSALNL
jgi:hypothetical protein